ncbi:MAG: single-stranded DNA-binding protein [Bacteroidetes bacterium MED-G21]|nr:MAG: single-stranded DNA-binding protein [Bacteroidetes bacterium MED-G21]
MTASMNKVILMGNLGKAPETRTLESGVVMCRFPIATSETYKNRKSGEKTSHTEWHNVVLWRGLAEVAEKYLNKGDKILIEGRIRSRSWEDKESGQMRFITEILTDQMQMIGSVKRSPSSDDFNTAQEPTESFIQESPIDQEEDLPF